MASASLLLLLATTPTHVPIDCFVKNRFPLVYATIEPVADVGTARTHFKREKDDRYFAVEMLLVRGRFEGRLPKPTDEGEIVYFLEVIENDGTVRRTPRMSAIVVKREEDCADEGRIAEDAGKGGVQVLAPRGASPRGFGGISRTLPLESAPPTDDKRPTVPSQQTAGATTLTKLPGSAVTPGDDYRLGPQDIIRVVVYGDDDLTQTVVVQSDGTFTFPLIGRVQAAGKTIKELERAITTALGKGFVRNPQVTVVVQEYKSQSVFLVGEVARPGTYTLQGPTTVVEVLAKAGQTANAGHEVIVVRPKQQTEGPLLPGEVAPDVADVFRVNIREIRMGKLDQNILLAPGDTVFVSEAAKVFVSGEVKNGGAYTFTPGITVRQAISMAGGLSPEGSSGRIRVVREVDGQMKEIKVKIDDPVEAGDTIVVKSKLF
jgi:polysaccharide export outer membrane protein